MIMKYKPSMFNRTLSENSSLILYNSFGGTRKLLKVMPEKVNKVKRWLDSEIIDETDDQDFSSLVQLGYLVTEDTDEKDCENFVI